MPSISISQQAKKSLDSIKHQGQSYDSLLQELVKFWKEKKSRTPGQKQRT